MRGFILSLLLLFSSTSAPSATFGEGYGAGGRSSVLTGLEGIGGSGEHRWKLKEALDVYTAVRASARRLMKDDTVHSGFGGSTNGMNKTESHGRNTTTKGGTGGVDGEGRKGSTIASVRWCCSSPREFLFCRSVVPSLSTTSQHWSCVNRGSREACMEAVREGIAELLTLDAGIAYDAFLHHRMKGVVMERLDEGEEYDAVVVVKKELCQRPAKEGPLLISHLQGLKSCHPYYRSAAGWYLPLDVIVAATVEGKEVDMGVAGGDYDIIQKFFSASCVPGDSDGKRICSACRSGGDAGPCDSRDAFAGFPGAFRCLMEGAGDVAFLKTPIVPMYALGGRYQQQWSSRPASDFRYLCPRGGCIDVIDNPRFFNCTLGRVPANVIMTRNSLQESDRVAIRQVLQQAGQELHWTRTMYEGGNPSEFILSSTARGLVEVGHMRDYLGHLAEQAAQIQGLESTAPPSLPSSSPSLLHTGVSVLMTCHVILAAALLL